MTYEFYGSMLTFMVALLFSFFRPRSTSIVIIILIYFLRREPFYIAFLLGVLGTTLSIERRKLNGWVTVILCLSAIYFCGFALPIGAYGWIKFLSIYAKIGLPGPFVQAIGAFQFLIVFGTQNIVSRQFTGVVSKILGQISFPLYLVHTLIICSFSATIYTYLGGTGWAIAAAAAVLIVVLAPLVTFLAWFDQKWLKILSAWRFPNMIFLKLSPYIFLKPRVP